MDTLSDPVPDKPFKLGNVTNAERIIASEQLLGMPTEAIENYAMAMAAQLMKAFISRERIAFALIEHLINTGQGPVAGRIVGAMGIQACQMRHCHKELIRTNPMGISATGIQALEERLAGADMGMTVSDIESLLGTLPEF